jgi:hypothetical protein
MKTQFYDHSKKLLGSLYKGSRFPQIFKMSQKSGQLNREIKCVIKINLLEITLQVSGSLAVTHCGCYFVVASSLTSFLNINKFFY